MAKTKIKKGDSVIVLAGKDKGQIGKVVAVYRENDRVLVEGVNRVTRHTKAGMSGGQNRAGGLVVQEAPIHVSNVALAEDSKPTRTKTRVETVERDGRTKNVRTRVSVRSGKDI